MSTIRPTAKRMLWAMTAALAMATGPHAQGAPYPVNITVDPAYFGTFFANAQGEDDYACWPFTCFNASGHGAPAMPSDGQIAVGFDYFYDPGTEPCPCTSYHAHVHRGVVYFRTTDIPQSFVKASLILFPIKTEQKSNSRTDAVTGIYEISTIEIQSTSASVKFNVMTPKNADAKTRERHFSVVSGNIANDSTTSFLAPSTNLGKPVITPFPANPGPNDPKVKKDVLKYSIDVTDAVKTWVADWVNRDIIPFHGFIVRGADEVLSTNKNSKFVVHYAPFLFFETLDPDL